MKVKESFLVSVVVPIYNSSFYLERCIDSILYQTYQNIEVILIDDGSTDDSWEKCVRYQKRDSRIKAFRTENHGVSSARNYGLDICTGEWVYFVDSDDWIFEKAIESLVDSNMNKNCLYLHQAQIVYADNSKFKKWPYIYSDCILDLDCLNDYNMLDKVFVYGTPWGKLYNIDIIRKYGIKFDEKLSLHEDHCFYLNYISYIEKIKIVSQPLYNYWIAVNRDSLSAKKKVYDPNILLYSYDVLLLHYNNILNKYKLDKHLFICFNTFLTGIELSALKNAIKSNWSYSLVKPVMDRIEVSKVKKDFNPETKKALLLKQVFLLPNSSLKYWMLKLINITTNRL